MEIAASIAARAREGALLTRAELAELDTSDVLSLGMLADEVRRARVGDGVSYTQVLEINAANTPWEREGTPLGLSSGEVRINTRPESLDAAVATVAAIRGQVSPPCRLAGFSLDELIAREWGPLDTVLRQFQAVGLDAIAEAPVDRVADDQIGSVLAAGLALGRLSVRGWQGDGAIDLLLRVRATVETFPALRAFAPLAREQSVATPTTGYQDVKLVALARLALPTVAVIEVDWQQYGPKLAQVALMFGANHLDRVSAADDASLGPRRASAEEVRRNIVAAGFTPVEPGEAA